MVGASREDGVIDRNLDKLRIDRKDANRRSSGGHLWLFLGLAVILVAVTLGILWMRTDRPELFSAT